MVCERTHAWMGWMRVEPPPDRFLGWLVGWVMCGSEGEGENVCVCAGGPPSHYITSGLAQKMVTVQRGVVWCRFDEGEGRGGDDMQSAMRWCGWQQRQHPFTQTVSFYRSIPSFLLYVKIVPFPFFLLLFLIRKLWRNVTLTPTSHLSTTHRTTQKKKTTTTTTKRRKRETGEAFDYRKKKQEKKTKTKATTKNDGFSYSFVYLSVCLSVCLTVPTIRTAMARRPNNRHKIEGEGEVESEEAR